MVDGSFVRYLWIPAGAVTCWMAEEEFIKHDLQLFVVLAQKETERMP